MLVQKPNPVNIIVIFNYIEQILFMTPSCEKNIYLTRTEIHEKKIATKYDTWIQCKVASQCAAHTTL